MESPENKNEYLPSEVMIGTSKPQWLSSLLRIGGAIGFLIHLFALVTIFVIRPRLVQTIQSSTSQIELQTEELNQILSRAEVSLLLASETLSDTSDMLTESKDFLGKSSILLRSVGEMIGKDATETIVSTQDALEAAIPGSQAIDSMLKALSVLEPITGFSYDPEKSLAQSVDEVTASLEPLPDSLRDVQSQLDEAADELDEISPSLVGVAENLSLFSVSIRDISQQLQSGDDAFKSILDAVDKIQNRIAPISWISTIILGVFLSLGHYPSSPFSLLGNRNNALVYLN